MKYRKFISTLLAVAMISTMTLEVHAEDSRISLDGGNGSWHGGVTDDGVTVYSKIWDHVVNNEAFKATVWVKDALGRREEKTGETYGVNKEGELKITCEAVYSPFNKNKAGYKDLSIVKVNARQVYRRDMTAPSSFEAEFACSNPAVKK